MFQKIEKKFFTPSQTFCQSRFLFYHFFNFQFQNTILPLLKTFFHPTNTDPSPTVDDVGTLMIR